MSCSRSRATGGRGTGGRRAAGLLVPTVARARGLREQGARVSGSRPGQDRRKAPGKRRPARGYAREGDAVALRHCGYRGHTGGHSAGQDGGGPGSRRHCGHPVHRPEPPGLRSVRGDNRRLRRHLRHPGELQAHACRAGRRVAQTGQVREVGQLLLRALHA